MINILCKKKMCWRVRAIPSFLACPFNILISRLKTSFLDCDGLWFGRFPRVKKSWRNYLQTVVLSSSVLKTLVDNDAPIVDESAMVDFALGYLNRFRSIVKDSFSGVYLLLRVIEAWIINGVLFAAVSPTGEYLTPPRHEAINMESEDIKMIKKNCKRIGTGPLDYIFYTP